MKSRKALDMFISDSVLTLEYLYLLLQFKETTAYF